ncbi:MULTISPECIES: hypothetical protein [unclassified Janthinobacterium]|uniref:hypothetical protein n=1 Tax=unclassified Janthinobacterium TaxID=2610881 RepID=UPI000881B4DA|nr:MULTISPECIES: hypothetical protein [unclassified Janthinobacterium]SDA68065.1 hypothetical protein SAMN03159349_03227 [Janthinobacterium sp. 551a]SFB50927.1 hypothetical protein SAMN03159300_106149 [Janthinobacterium sp. 344]
MTSLNFPPALRRLGLAFLLGTTALTASAVPIAEMRLEDLLPMAPDFKTELKLNANQTILWQQVEGRTRQLLRERKARRERLQAAVTQGLQAPRLELRDLVGGLDNESTLSLAEEKQVREWWLSVNDALDEQQRQMVAQFIAGQMARVMDAAAPHGEPRGAPAGEHGGRKGGGKGGMGGAGGMGMNVGSGGASMNFPEN